MHRADRSRLADCSQSGRRLLADGSSRRWRATVHGSAHSMVDDAGSDGSAGGAERLSLTAPDWIVLSLHLTLTLAVGLFVTSRKQSGADAMLAGRSMSGFTIALSLVSGLTSGISYLGFPGYVFVDGVVRWLSHWLAPAWPPPRTPRTPLIPAAPLRRASALSSWHSSSSARSAPSSSSPSSTRSSSPQRTHTSRCALVASTAQSRRCCVIPNNSIGFNRKCHKMWNSPLISIFYSFLELLGGPVLSRVCCYLGVVLYAPALLLHTCLGFPLWATILFTGCLSTIWTVKGGMFAVVYTGECHFTLFCSISTLSFHQILLLSLVSLAHHAGVAFSRRHPEHRDDRRHRLLPRLYAQQNRRRLDRDVSNSARG